MQSKHEMLESEGNVQQSGSDVMQSEHDMLEAEGNVQQLGSDAMKSEHDIPLSEGTPIKQKSGSSSKTSIRHSDLLLSPHHNVYHACSK